MKQSESVRSLGSTVRAPPSWSALVRARPSVLLLPSCWLPNPRRCRPSAFQAGHIPRRHESCERDALPSVAAACRRSLLLLSLLLSAVVAARTGPRGSRWAWRQNPLSAARTGVRAPHLPPWPWSLACRPSPHRTDCCRPIRRRGGVKGRFACTFTRHFNLCSLPCGQIGP